MVNRIREHSFLSKVEITSLPSADVSNFLNIIPALILSIIILKANNYKNPIEVKVNINHFLQSSDLSSHVTSISSFHFHCLLFQSFFFFPSFSLLPFICLNLFFFQDFIQLPSKYLATFTTKNCLMSFQNFCLMKSESC